MELDVGMRVGYGQHKISVAQWSCVRAFLVLLVDLRPLQVDE